MIRTWLAVTVGIAAAGTTAPTSAQGVRLVGFVVDSLGRRPLAAAHVQLVARGDPSRARTTVTDSLGAFAFDSVSAGLYVLGFLHDLTDSLGLDLPELAVAVGQRTVGPVVMGIPSAATLVKRLCGTNAARDSTGLLLGRLRQASDRRTTQGAVTVSWTELRFTRRGLERASPSQRIDVSADGWFAVCGIPIASPVVVRGFSGADSSGFLELDVPLQGLLRRDVVVGEATSRLVADVQRSVRLRDGLPPTVDFDTSAVRRVARGSGKVQGTVRVVTGAPLAGVRVGVWATGIEAETDEGGRFVLDSVPAGSQTVIARSIGFVPYRAPADVPPNDSVAHDIVLAPFVAALDTVRVRVDRRAETWSSGFYARRAAGGGEFLDEAAIEKRHPLAVSDLLRDMPGIDVLASGAFGRRVVMRGRSTGLYCIPAVFVDGLRFYTGQAGRPSDASGLEYAGTSDLEYVVNPNDVKAVEVYTHDANVPAQFDDPRDGCGSIVIWTGARRKP